MRSWFGWFVPVAASALVTCGCGDTKRQAAESGGAPATGGVAAGGSTATPTGGGGDASNAGAAQGGLAGSPMAQGGEVGSGGGATCVPVAHARPVPASLTGTFASLIGDFVGVYAIDDVYEQADDCTSMCRTGSSFGRPPIDLAYLSVAPSSSEHYDIYACKSVEDCTSAAGVRSRVGAVDSAQSDQILSSERTYVENPQGQTCIGGIDDTWLIATAPSKIRVDVQEVRVEFAAYFNEVSQLYGCDSGDALAAAQGKPCNSLSVIDATRVE